MMPSKKSRQWGFISTVNVTAAILTFLFTANLSAQPIDETEDIKEPSCMLAANEFVQKRVLTLAEEILTVDGVVILDAPEPSTFIYNPSQTLEEREQDIKNNLLVHNDMLYSLTAIVSPEVAVERGIPDNERSFQAGFIIVRCGANDSKEVADSWWQLSLFPQP